MLELTNIPSIYGTSGKKKFSNGSLALLCSYNLEEALQRNRESVC